MFKYLFLLFYPFARNLPISYNRFGKISSAIRYFLASHYIKKCGKNVNFEKGALFGYNLEIGDNSGVGINSQISRGVKIGKNVMMAPEVVILTSNHSYDKTDIPMIFQGSHGLKEVVIEDDVWIGHRTIILPGVTLHKGTIVGAGSVVTKSFPNFSIIAGNPAKLIKSRLEK
jgi:maltose O-acetyltransferase